MSLILDAIKEKLENCRNEVVVKITDEILHDQTTGDLFLELLSCATKNVLVDLSVIKKLHERLKLTQEEDAAIGNDLIEFIKASPNDCDDENDWTDQEIDDYYEYVKGF